MSACYCMGPRNGEPLCPCQMRLVRDNAPTLRPHGCVCPPGAEATCQGFACPRRNPLAGYKPSPTVVT